MPDDATSRVVKIRREILYGFLPVPPRLVRTALASAALLVLGTVAAPAANAYNPDIDGDGIPNTWEMKGYDADGDGKIDVDYPGMGANPLKK